MISRSERGRVWVAKLSALALACSAAAAACAPRAALKPSAAWSAHTWANAAPEAVGIDSLALSNMLRRVQEQGLRVHHIYIARHGRSALDATLHPSTAGHPHRLDEATGVVTATLYGVALQRGLVPPPHTLVTDAFQLPERPDDTAWSRLTIADLLNMRTGLVYDPERAPSAPACEPADPAQWLSHAFELYGDTIPGVELEHLPLATQLLGALIEQATGEPLADFAEHALFAPLGITGAEWRTQAGTTDAITGLSLPPAALARIATPPLFDGMLGDTRMLPPEWTPSLESAQTALSRGVPYLRHWHIWPEGVLAGVGRGGQYWIVDRTLDTVVVIHAGEVEARVPQVEALWFDHIRPALSPTPLPANRAAADALQARVNRLAHTPIQGDASSRPASARAVEGRWFNLENNPADAARVSFSLLNPLGAVLVDWENTRARLSFGFAGALERSENLSDALPFGPTLAALGRWEGPTTLLLEVDTVSAIERWDVRVEFGERAITLEAAPTILTGPLDPGACLLQGSAVER